MVEAAVIFDRALPEQSDYATLVSDAHQRLVDMNNGYEKVLRQLELLLAEKEELTQQLQRANKELQGIAATDPLTGLANRRAFEEALKRDFSRADRANQPISVLVLDIDFFKKVNDTHGHSVGDLVLQKVAEVLKASVRTGDVPARIGGEEFVVVLPATDADGARVVAERIRQAVAAASVNGSSGPFSVTTSVGLATCRGSSVRDGGKGAVERADAALYEAKRSGRNRVVVAK
jgi:diguanylate cyclase (GGDEF)-like protein